MFTSGLLLLLLFAMWVCLHVAERRLFAGLGIVLLLGCYAVNSLPAALVSAACLAVGICTRRHGAVFAAGSLALLGAVNLDLRVQPVYMIGANGPLHNAPISIDHLPRKWHNSIRRLTLRND